jgi:chorismate mutase/prephenate dehydrogenase
VLVATPPSVAASLYNQWASHPPRGVVADIASIKSPLVGPLRALQKAGTSVASFHPLFGPSLASLRGADIVLCTAGDAKAEQAIRALFAPTCARLVDVSLEEHDHLMAEVLSLAHATAIAYAAACSGPTAVHSTTQRKLAGLAASVVRESPQVYFEIQAGNPHSAAALQRLESALAALHEAVRGGDARGFAALLEKGRRKLPVEAGP